MENVPVRPRALAICVIEQESRLLVQNGYDLSRDEHFGRPLGGSIEFGERGAETIIREFQEK